MQDNKKQQNDTFSNVHNASRARDMRHESTHEEFILWYALPRHEKIRMGLEWQEDFAKYHNLAVQTLSRWKSQPDFQPQVKQLRDGWTKGRTSDVIAAIYRSATSGHGNAINAQKLWMQLFEGFSEKRDRLKKEIPTVSVRDVRFIIDGFPEATRGKYQMYLSEIIDEAERLRQAGELEDKVMDYDEEDEEYIHSYDINL